LKRHRFHDGDWTARYSASGRVKAKENAFFEWGMTRARAVEEGGVRGGGVSPADVRKRTTFLKWRSDILKKRGMHP